MYYDSVQKKESTAMRCPSFKNGDEVQKLVPSMADNLTLGEWELHTLEDMNWHDNHEHCIKYWSQDIIKCMTWVMLQAADAEHLIYALQRCFNSDRPPKRLYTEMRTTDWWWEKQVRTDTRA